MINFDLKSKASPWLHISEATSAAVYTLALHLNESNEDRTRALQIRGQKCQNRQALFNEIGAVLQLPAYFGENLDALDECIKDLEWLPADHYILIFTNSNQLLIDESTDDILKVLGQILFSAAQHWNGERGKSFHILFQGDSKRRISEALNNGQAEYTIFM